MQLSDVLKTDVHGSYTLADQSMLARQIGTQPGMLIPSNL